ncbi:MAG TPA: polymer-forming cytoskeletal protein [Rhizomicrobium sp.]|jgi:cytoskeletal protein CcmA (bactofilin family)|nr:polymer-forming cytoskeletal protein [Rhizomicrobium sp.]
MTMFSRNDKMPEPTTAAKPAATAAPINTTPNSAPQPAPAPVEARRVSSSPAAHGGTQSVSVISKALKITGQLESTEDIHIEGEVDGDIRGVGVKIGHNAKVKGTVYGEQVEVAGTVIGKVEARKVVIASTGHMSGDVIHLDIRIDSGAYIDGHCRPEYGKPDGKAHAIQKPAAAPAPNYSTAKPAEPARSTA